MRFVITVEDVIFFGLLAIGIVLAVIGVVLNLIRKMGERIMKSGKER